METFSKSMCECNCRGRGKTFIKSKVSQKPQLPNQKSKSTYIPEDFQNFDDDEEILKTSISSGVNFDKYEDISVKVSGENPVQPISSFEKSQLKPSILEVIRKSNYAKPTPIQKYCIPIIFNRRDVMACAQTGSGKTAAFLLPIISMLIEQDNHLDFSCNPHALIISPTRELSLQIFNEARKFSVGTNLKVAIIYGATSVAYQLNNIKNGCHILVATPGRLLDFLDRGVISFTNTKFVVLDEADRMLDAGFLPVAEKILSVSSNQSTGDIQKLLFSATFPEEIQRLADKFLQNYLFVAVGIVGGACTDVEQKFICVSKYQKRLKLVELLNEIDTSKCLIFVEQKRTADIVATYLCEKDFPATSIHGDREQKQREEALRDFKTGKMDILVATSVAARGLDIKNVTHVVNYDLPNSIEDYVHRIGRTGRVGNKGLATSFFDLEQDKSLAPALIKILNQAGQVVPDFLQELQDSHSFNGFSNDSTPEFGAKDFRKRFEVVRETTFEDEQW